MTEEDEAFDELARKQGMWGGGFKAKQAMAADKLQEPEREALKLALEALEEYADQEGKTRAADEALTAIQAALAQPAQKPVAYVTGVSFGRFIVEPLNPAMVLPVGMALYSAPQGNK